MHRTFLRVFLCSIICNSSTAWSAEDLSAQYVKSIDLEKLLITQMKLKQSNSQLTIYIQDGTTYYDVMTCAPDDPFYYNFKTLRNDRNQGLQEIAVLVAACALGGWLWRIKEYSIFSVPTILCGALAGIKVVETYNDHQKLLEAQGCLGKFLRSNSCPDMLNHRFSAQDFEEQCEFYNFTQVSNLPNQDFIRMNYLLNVRTWLAYTKVQ